MTSVKPVLKRSIKYAVLAAFAAYAAAVSGKYQAVLDGDTLRIGRDSVRLVGIDAPETAQTCVCKGETVPCGRIATEKLFQMIGSNTVVCETRDRDFYGRLLGECFVTENGERINLNRRMVETGLAVASRYDALYWDQERDAVQEKRGFWACEGFENPADFKKSN